MRVLHHKQKARGPTNGFRRHAWNRFGRCQWCNELVTWEESTVDHIVSRSRGGKNGWSNLCLSCAPCNNHKQSQDWGRPRYGPKDWSLEPYNPKVETFKPNVWESSLTFALNIPMQNGCVMEMDS